MVFHGAFVPIPWNNGLTERLMMKCLRQHLAFGGVLAVLALGAASAVADSSLFPNGEPNWFALRTAGSHSVASAATSLDDITLDLPPLDDFDTTDFDTETTDTVSESSALTADSTDTVADFTDTVAAAASAASRSIPW